MASKGGLVLMNIGEWYLDGAWKLKEDAESHLSQYEENFPSWEWKIEEIGQVGGYWGLYRRMTE